MIKKEIEFHEIEIKFLVRKGSCNAETINELTKNIWEIFYGVEINDISYEKTEVFIDGKARLEPAKK
jgi:hypothetical protein